MDKLTVSLSAYNGILGEISSAASFLGNIKRIVFEFADGKVEMDGKKIE